MFSKFFDNLYLIRQNFKNYFFNLTAHLYIKVYLAVALGINIIIWVFGRFIVSKIGAEQMALHYNVDFGIDFYGNVKNIYIIPLLGLLIILINFFLFASISGHKDKVFISHLLFLPALFANIILLAAMSSVYLVNFR